MNYYTYPKQKWLASLNCFLKFCFPLVCNRVWHFIEQSYLVWFANQGINQALLLHIITSKHFLYSLHFLQHIFQKSMIAIFEARPSLVFIKFAWLCIQAPWPCFSLQQGRGPGVLQAPKLWANPLPTNGVMLPWLGLVDTNFWPACIYDSQQPQILSRCVLVSSHQKGKVFSHPTCLSPHLPKLWLAAWAHRDCDHLGQLSLSPPLGLSSVCAKKAADLPYFIFTHPYAVLWSCIVKS